MDYMDPKQRKRQVIMLIAGYVLTGIAVLLLTTIIAFMVVLDLGFKNGQVVQNGIVFLSSAPNSAQIYINGKRYGSTTNTRLNLPADTYMFDLQRSGYRDWQRSIIVEGAQALSFTYPFLFPTTLNTSTKQEYALKPALVTQSPDRHWLLVSRPRSFASFDIYDLNNPTSLQTVISLPVGLLGPGTTQSLSLVEWSNDNTHVLLKHVYGGKTEYILLNRSAPEQSLNLTKTLSLAAADDLKLSNKRYDRYYIFDAVAQTLKRATLSTPQEQPYLTKVLAYATYGDNAVLYATPDLVNAAQVDMNLYDGSSTYTIRHDAAHTTYSLNLTAYNGKLYVAIAAQSENVAFVYEDPVKQITNQQLGVAVPVRAFRIKAPSHVAFSTNTQYVTFENGNTFAVFDAENQRGYTFTVPDKLDSPQAQASWMDGARLLYVSKGQLVVFDYDGNNRQTLAAADPRYLPYFDRNYKYLYSLAPSATDRTHELLTATPLRIPADM